jgi:hypothetical protein
MCLVAKCFDGNTRVYRYEMCLDTTNGTLQSAEEDLGAGYLARSVLITRGMLLLLFIRVNIKR